MAYPALNPLPDGIKTGILLETGFDKVSPNRPCLITSWAYEQVRRADIPDLTDNRAQDVLCYEPGYTLVEKLQTISTKYRKQQESEQMPANFMRHYYDVYCLLDDPQVQAFIGTEAYYTHKNERFRGEEQDISRNPAFSLTDPDTRTIYENAYVTTRALYYRDQPSMNAILDKISKAVPTL